MASRRPGFWRRDNHQHECRVDKETPSATQTSELLPEDTRARETSTCHHQPSPQAEADQKILELVGARTGFSLAS